MTCLKLRLVAVLFAITLVTGVAYAANTPVHAHKGDQITVTVSKAGARKLAGEHVKLTARNPAQRHGNRVTAPDRSGSWNFPAATGTVHYAGELRFSRGHRVAVARYLVLVRSKRQTTVTAMIAGRRVTLLKLGGRTKVSRSRGSETISLAAVRFAPQGAKAVNRRLGARVIAAGQQVGTATVKLSQPSSSPTPGGPGRTQPGVALAVSPALKAVGVTSNPISPALSVVTIPGGTVIELPAGAGGGSFNQGTLTGTIPLSGGLTLGDGAAQVALTDPVLTLGTGTDGSSLSFSVNGGPEVKLLSLDTSKLLSSTTSNGSLDLQGLTATLSQEGADSINQAAGTPLVAPAQTFGNLSVIVPKT